MKTLIAICVSLFLVASSMSSTFAFLGGVWATRQHGPTFGPASFCAMHLSFTDKRLQRTRTCS
jgi:hypothetical protein